MWNWVNCHLLGRHREIVTSDRVSIHLRCVRCGRRSAGWPLIDRRSAPESARLWPPAVAQTTPRQPS